MAVSRTIWLILVYSKEPWRVVVCVSRHIGDRLIVVLIVKSIPGNCGFDLIGLDMVDRCRRQGLLMIIETVDGVFVDLEILHLLFH